MVLVVDSVNSKWVGIVRNMIFCMIEIFIRSRNRTIIRNIGPMHMFTGQFFMGNSNFEVS